MRKGVKIKKYPLNKIIRIDSLITPTKKFYFIIMYFCL